MTPQKSKHRTPASVCQIFHPHFLMPELRSTNKIICVSGLHDQYERCAADSASALLLVFLHSESVIPKILIQDLRRLCGFMPSVVCWLLLQQRHTADGMVAACGNYRESER